MRKQLKIDQLMANRYHNIYVFFSYPVITQMIQWTFCQAQNPPTDLQAQDFNKKVARNTIKVGEPGLVPNPVLLKLSRNELNLMSSNH